MTTITNQKVLVLGATGATGSLVVKQLLAQDVDVIALVRSAEKLKGLVGKHPKLRPIVGTILTLEEDTLADIMEGITGVISCLGHTLNLRGIYGKPRKLVTESVKKVCRAIEALNPAVPVKLVLMNTTGYRNQRLDKPRGRRERLIVGLVRLMVPPHTDNEAAADYLLKVVGNQCKAIDWVIVRPDGLIDEDAISFYQSVPSPVRSPILNPGQTSRINVADFMTRLIVDPVVLADWKFTTPVIYNIDLIP